MNPEITRSRDSSRNTPFVQRFSASRRGARLARLLAVQQLDMWGVPYGSELSDTAAVIVAELAANAATHGRADGWGFELRLELTAGVLRIQVSDRSPARLPQGAEWASPPSCESEAGRGLLLVEALATRWNVVEKDNGPGKTVKAEVDVCTAGLGPAWSRVRHV